MKIALIFHDKMKPEMIEFVKKLRDGFTRHDLIITDTTGHKIIVHTGLNIKCFGFGPLSENQEIGSQLANGKIDMIFFFRVLLTAQPHEPDVNTLLRLNDVYKIPLTTNISTAEHIIKKLE